MEASYGEVVSNSGSALGADVEAGRPTEALAFPTSKSWHWRRINCVTLRKRRKLISMLLRNGGFTKANISPILHLNQIATQRRVVTLRTSINGKVHVSTCTLPCHRKTREPPIEIGPNLGVFNYELHRRMTRFRDQSLKNNLPSLIVWPHQDYVTVCNSLYIERHIAYCEMQLDRCLRGPETLRAYGRPYRTLPREIENYLK